MQSCIKNKFDFYLHKVCRILEGRHTLLFPLQEEVICTGDWIRRNDSEFISICLLPREVHANLVGGISPRTDSNHFLYLEDIHVIVPMTYLVAFLDDFVIVTIKESFPR